MLMVQNYFVYYNFTLNIAWLSFRYITTFSKWSDNKRNNFVLLNIYIEHEQSQNKGQIHQHRII